MTAATPRLAIVGCGAVTEQRHLPALAALDVRAALLVDPNLARAEELAAQFRAGAAAADYADYLDLIDGAIVASPAASHARIAGALLTRGIHVLVEKPMALTAADGAAMVAAARQGRAVLAVGLMRRFLRAARWTKSAIDAGLLGRIESFDVREGSPYAWPVASPTTFQRHAAGGGVLSDTGAHTLDLITWWLGELTVASYRDDNFGGVEADCEMTLRTAGGAEGVVELSRTRRLRCTAIIRGSAGEIEVSVYKNQITARPASLLRGCRLEPQSFDDLFVLQLRDWMRAFSSGRPHVSGQSALPSIALIESCYRRRAPLDLPWLETTPVCPFTTVP
jgi:predicted dehydrogenase